MACSGTRRAEPQGAPKALLLLCLRSDGDVGHFVLAAAALPGQANLIGIPELSKGDPTITHRSRLPLLGVEPEVTTAVPRIALTIASMVMSPFGLQAENFLVAEDDEPGDGRLGFAQLRRLGPSDSQVKAEARGRGLGSRLVRALLGRSDEPGKRTVYALTLKNKLGFFERLQFKELSGKDLSLLPTELGLEAQLGRVIAPIAAGEPLVVLRYEGP
ncbi:hypothetical protein AK812_SmicGene13573 [Symbiodinium microadriaticum]|uniref:N-acetyltransferase domain-containing protein n=1 Tax=Symbiodinium microadriaticum TaxID=2951 RepID=A0A1Q9E7T7_SYMMI|nr:hypothetical protein AK812_SmicGene13573 [Symbiodinium microadriaticum]